MNGSDLNKKRIHSDFFYIEKELAGGPGVAPSYVNLESTRSHFDPPPASLTPIERETLNSALNVRGYSLLEFRKQADFMFVRPATSKIDLIPSILLTNNV
jgi:hypothetical protein